MLTSQEQRSPPSPPTLRKWSKPLSSQTTLYPPHRISISWKQQIDYSSYIPISHLWGHRSRLETTRSGSMASSNVSQRSVRSSFLPIRLRHWLHGWMFMLTIPPAGDLWFQSQRRAWSQVASQAGVKTFAYLFTDPAPPAFPPYFGGEFNTTLLDTYNRLITCSVSFVGCVLCLWRAGPLGRLRACDAPWRPDDGLLDLLCD
jgi:hypothetical protein